MNENEDIYAQHHEMPSKNVDDKPSRRVSRKPSMDTGPANPRNTNKPSMNVDSPSAQRKHKVHVPDPALEPVVLSEGTFKGLGHVELTATPSRAGDGKMKLSVGFLGDVSARDRRAAIRQLLHDANVPEGNKTDPHVLEKATETARQGAKDRVEHVPPILRALDIEQYPLPAGTRVSGEESGDAKLVATLRFVDGVWVSGWETASTSGIQAEGTETLYKVLALRAYYLADGSLVPVTVAYSSSNMELKPTWDWVRAHE